MRPNILILLSLFLFRTYNCSCQTSVVQDAKGETSLNLGSEGIVAVNAKEESLSFSFGANVGTLANANSRTDTYLGIKAKAKAKNSISSLIKSENFQYDGSLGFFAFQTKTHLTGPVNRTDHFFISADYLLSRIKLFDQSRPFADQIIDEAPGGFKLSLGYSQENQITGLFPYVFGISVNAGQKNNTDELKALSIGNIITYSDPLSGQTRSVQQDVISAYDFGKYKNSISFFNFNADIGPQLGTRFLFLLHPRYSVMQYRKPQFNPAVGFYLTGGGAPLEIVAGIQVQIQDYANTAKSDRSRGERTVLNLVAGFVF